MGLNLVLLLSLVAVVLIQAVNRLAGAIASVVWTLGLGAYGFWLLNNGLKTAVLGIEVQMWHFLTFITGALVYNSWVLYRQLRARAR